MANRQCERGERVIKIDEISCRPRQLLESTSRMYPGFWKTVDSARSMRGKDIKGWPELCFLPIALVQSLFDRAGRCGDNLVQKSVVRLEVLKLTALAAWRVTQGIYRFDPDVYEAVQNTPIEGDLPGEVLSHIPEWCIYIETPGMTVMGDPVYGAWVHIDWADLSENAELRILVDSTDLTPIVLSLSRVSIQEQIEHRCELAVSHGRLNSESAQTLNKSMMAFAKAIVPLVLYLCSEAAEIGDGTRRPMNPTPTRVKGGGSRLFPPNGVTTWGVGVRLGAALRRATQYASVGGGETNLRNAPRGHIRRAHWHGVRSGPTKTADGQTICNADRVLKVRWQLPLAINLGDLSDLPSTIRPVSCIGNDCTL